MDQKEEKQEPEYTQEELDFMAAKKRKEAKLKFDAQFRESLLDNTINPLLANDTTNRDIFRTLLFHYNTDNYIPIDKCAYFLQNFLVQVDDEGSHDRFGITLTKSLQKYSSDGKNLNEDQFCEFMRSYELETENEQTDMEQYEGFLEKIFHRLKKEEDDQTVALKDFVDSFQRVGFRMDNADYDLI